MKRISILFLLLYVSLSCAYAQSDKDELSFKEYFESVPFIYPGYEKEFPLDNKGKNVLTLRVESLERSDSTSNLCKQTVRYLASVKGKGVTFTLNKQECDVSPSEVKSLSKYPIEAGVSIKEGQEVIITDSEDLSRYAPFIISISFGQGHSTKGSKDIPYVRIPAYDNGEYLAKLEARNQARMQEEIEAKRREAENRARIESSRAESKERQDLLLTPDYLANWVGAGFFTKKSIEHDCGVSPVAYNGGAVMYDFSKCPVTMVFDDESEVCIQLSFRLFGEDGYQMKRALIDYGYKVQSKSTGDLIAENNFENLQRGTTTIYKCKLNAGDYSTCELIEGQAMMFTFYRTRK